MNVIPQPLKSVRIENRNQLQVPFILTLYFRSNVWHIFGPGKSSYISVNIKDSMYIYSTTYFISQYFTMLSLHIMSCSCVIDGSKWFLQASSELKFFVLKELGRDLKKNGNLKMHYQICFTWIVKYFNEMQISPRSAKRLAFWR